ncbi:MAG: molybdenum cofactor synthesis protein [Bacteroidetes bacterium]|nr:molybdenum cofactor synthesis protein [Bacteroidota bacterium]
MLEKIRIVSVNISEEKGTIKKPVAEISLNDNGVEGDAHSGKWHRQISLLALESVNKFSALAGRTIAFGEFAENITTEGMLLYESHPLDIFVSGDVILEVTQIGKKCHGDSCAIFREVGNCVMPKEGIFCRVIRGGKLKEGDILEYIPYQFRAAVITLSDRASSGEYEDLSGPAVISAMETFFRFEGWPFDIVHHIIPDDPVQLDLLLKDATVSGLDFVFTTGGTGIGPRDITPEVIRENLDKEIPGIMEGIRIRYGMEKANALLSRSIAGVMGDTLIFALPGSVKAVNEYMTEIAKSLRHMVFMLHGIDSH